MRHAALLLLSLLPSFPQGADQKGRLEGQVVNASTGQPLRKVDLVLLATSSASGKSTGAVTNPEGHFTIDGVEPGSYRLVARHDGFVLQEYGQKPGRRGETLTFGPGDRKRDIVIRLMPLGVIAGRVLDQDGDPIQQVEVSAMVFEYSSSGRRLAPRKSVSTNDLGEYRIFGIDPGRYYVSARPALLRGFGRTDPEAADDNYITSYYPGATDAAGAAALDLTTGQQLSGIDMTLRKTRAASIRGRAIKPAGGSGLTVGLMTVNDNNTQSSSSGVYDPEGKFELRGIAAGSHILFATSNVGDKLYMVRLPVEVRSTDIEGIELHLRPPMEAAGQVIVEGKNDVKLSQLSLNITGRVESHEAPVNADGTFTLKSLLPDVYLISMNPPSGLYLKAVRWSDADITASGLDLTDSAPTGQMTVVLSANAGEIEGSVEPAGPATVTLVPLSPPRMTPFFKTIRTTGDGRFVIRGVAPGKYKLFAWDQVNSDAVLYDPEFLKRVDSNGKTVEIKENGKESVQLKLIANAADH